ncbi:MAG: hypothetical protein H6Q72_4528 [Firmicutes bacterium]|nr:hypothetical protein [Bacillota bacterium]
MRVFKVLAVCGTGMATSSHAAMVLQKGLKERGLEVQVRTCAVMEANGLIINFKPDVIVHTTSLASVSNLGDIKVFPGVALLTGVGADKLCNEIAAYLQEQT